MPTISPIPPGAATTGPDKPESRTIDAVRKQTTEEIDSRTIKEAVASNPRIVFGERSVEFSFNEDVRRVVVKVRSADTEEVVRQIPPEDYLQMVSQFRELFGVIFDEVA